MEDYCHGQQNYAQSRGTWWQPRPPSVMGVAEQFFWQIARTKAPCMDCASGSRVALNNKRNCYAHQDRCQHHWPHLEEVNPSGHMPDNCLRELQIR
jgi:hypothetical protein